MSFMCPVCDVEYNSLNELANHNINIHGPNNSKNEKQKISTAPTQEDFDRAKEILKKEKEKNEKIQVEKKNVSPPELKYKWEGVHDCGNIFDTIEILFDEKISVVCYCPNCKKQIAQRFVVPIEKQNKKFIRDKKTEELREL
jgi:hypothetical protein